MASFFTSIFLFLFSSPFVAALLPTQQIYQFPNGTHVENLAVRSDGSILVTTITAPELYLIQPSSTHPNPQLIHRFNGSTSVLGITETSPDSFQVGVTNVSTLKGVPGTGSLWTVTFPRRNTAAKNEAKISLTAKLPGVITPNGLVTLNNRKILLADSAKGIVLAIDTVTGASNAAITDALLAPTAKFPIGVNGIKLRGHTLYFTSSAQTLFGKVEIDLKTGAARGPASIIAHTLPFGAGYDDFALSNKGDAAFLTNGAGNLIERVDLRSGRQSIVAGSINSTAIVGPTSAKFGRNGREDVLYVTTGGGFLSPFNRGIIVGGQLVAVKVGQ
ncbi:MAG: hypothetical protein Q9201_005550 [Fulgogasparrea decipioides]